MLTQKAGMKKEGRISYNLDILYDFCVYIHL